MFCSKCGEKLYDDALFCMKCGTPAEQPKTQAVAAENKKVVYVASTKPYNGRIAVALTAIALLIAIIILAVILLSQSGSTLTGKYEYDDGRYYYTIDFKSNGICIFTDDTNGYSHSRSGTYEYTDGEYIMSFKMDLRYLATTYSATLSGDTLYVQQIAGSGPIKSGEFEKM